MEGSLFLPSFRILSKFVSCNKPLFKKLVYMVFKNAKRQCDKWGDYEMHLAPFDKTKPIYYEFTACPVAEFAKRHNLLEIMPALCNPDYESMELIHAKLVRTTTCSNGCKCDYCICGIKIRTLKIAPNIVMKSDTGETNNAFTSSFRNTRFGILLIIVCAVGIHSGYKFVHLMNILFFEKTTLAKSQGLFFCFLSTPHSLFLQFPVLTVCMQKAAAFFGKRFSEIFRIKCRNAFVFVRKAYCPFFVYFI